MALIFCFSQSARFNEVVLAPLISASHLVGIMKRGTSEIGFLLIRKEGMLACLTLPNVSAVLCLVLLADA
jgi:hypothetical protein